MPTAMSMTMHCSGQAYLLLQELAVRRAVRSEQVERPMSRITELLQLLLPVALLGCFYGPLLFCWTLMGSRGRLTPEEGDIQYGEFYKLLPANKPDHFWKAAWAELPVPYQLQASAQNICANHASDVHAS